MHGNGGGHGGGGDGAVLLVTRGNNGGMVNHDTLDQLGGGVQRADEQDSDENETGQQEA